MALSEGYVTLAKEEVIFESRRIGSQVGSNDCSNLHTSKCIPPIADPGCLIWGVGMTTLMMANHVVAIANAKQRFEANYLFGGV